MEHITNAIFIISVLNSFCTPILTNSIFQIVERNAVGSWRFNFSFRTEDFNGIILHCVDSDSNQFGLSIARNNSDKFICIRFRNKDDDTFTSKSLQELCGCPHCNNRLIEFEFELRNGIISLTCNKRSSHIINFNPEKPEPIGVIDFCAGQNNMDTIYPIEKSMTNKRNKLIIWMGNVGPYTADDDTLMAIAESQLVGCLNTFFYDNEYVKFTEKGTKFLKQCISCTGGLCNGGICLRATYDGPVCDCSTTAFNGPRCDAALQTYNKENHNSYQTLIRKNEIKMKLSWETSINNNYCLIEFIFGSNSAILCFKQGQLMIYSMENLITKFNKSNFCNIILTNQSLVVQINSKSFKLNANLSGNIRLNIGFTEIDDQCKPFEGLYDFYFKSNEIGKYRFDANLLSSTFTNLKSLHTASYLSSVNVPYLIVISIIAIAILLLICVVLKLAMHKKTKRRQVSENLYEFECIDNKNDPTYASIDYETV